jgi:hypothetical protein
MMVDLRSLLGLATLGAVLRVVFQITRPAPWDWDAAYYRIVARNIASGRGAVIDGVWTLAAPPASLPGPADLYWMPLPSRLLVPEMTLGGGAGGLVTIALIGALMGPLAWWLAREAGVDRSVAWTAGAFAAVGGAWCRLLATTDVYALTALLGGLALIGVLRQQWRLAAAAALLLALTRNDGFLVGLCLGLGFVGWRMAAVGLAGPLGTALWTLRNHLVGGDTFWTGRRAAAGALSYTDVFRGVDVAPTIAERSWATVEALQGVLLAWAWPSIIVFAPLLLWGAWVMRRDRLVRVWLPIFVAVPILTALIAPVTVFGGTLERTGISLLAAHAVLLAVATHALAERLQRWRGYHPAFVSGVVLTLWAAGSGWVAGNLLINQEPIPDCTAWAAVPGDRLALVSDPLKQDWHCGRSGVLLLDDTPASTLAALVARWDVCHAIVGPDDPRPDDWAAVADGVLQHPEWDGEGCAP